MAHIKFFDESNNKESEYYTASLIKLVQYEVSKNDPDFDMPIETSHMSLAEDWPWWSVPQYSIVKPEIQSDPRWNEWISKLK